MKEREFGPYLFEVDGNHLTIRRKDGKPVEPTFYEMQHMKCSAFGAPAVAVEIFPAMSDLVDGQHQRHLFMVDGDGLPNLKTGEKIIHSE